jgi:hypothetical protein
MMSRALVATPLRLSLSILLYGTTAAFAVGFIAYVTVFNVQ